MGKRRDSRTRKGAKPRKREGAPSPLGPRALYILKYQPNSEKRAAFYKVPRDPDGRGPASLIVQHAVEASRVAISIVGGHQDLLRNAPAFT